MQIDQSKMTHDNQPRSQEVRRTRTYLSGQLGVIGLRGVVWIGRQIFVQARVLDREAL